mgnify:CR=1 FL=1|jgi:hypothetical protein
MPLSGLAFAKPDFFLFCALAFTDPRDPIPSLLPTAQHQEEYSERRPLALSFFWFGRFRGDRRSAAGTGASSRAHHLHHPLT